MIPFNSGRVPQVLGQSGVAVPLTGSTSVTTLASIVVPANAMSQNGMLRIWVSYDFTNSANNKFFIVQFGGSYVLNYNTTTSNWLGRNIHMFNRGVTNSQVVEPVNAGTGIGSQTAASSILAVDTTQQQTLTISAQLANSGETITLSSYCVELLNF